MLLRRFYCHLRYRNPVRIEKSLDGVSIPKKWAVKLAIEPLVAESTFEALSWNMVQDHNCNLILSHEADSKKHVITRGTLKRSTYLDTWKNNYIASVCVSDTLRVGLAWVDLNEGTLEFQNSTLHDLADDLARINPQELLIESPVDHYESTYAYTTIEATFPRDVLKYTGCFDSQQNFKHSLAQMPPMTLAATAGLLGYIIDTQAAASPVLSAPQEFTYQSTLRLDKRSRSTLELLASSTNGTVVGSLFSVIKRTRSPSGTRALRHLISNPHRCIETINNRLNKVDSLYDSTTTLELVQELFRQMPDGKKALQTIAASASPRYIYNLAESIELMKKTVDLLAANPRFGIEIDAISSAIREAGSMASKVVKYFDIETFEEYSDEYKPIMSPKFSKSLTQLYKHQEMFEETTTALLQKYRARYEKASIKWSNLYRYHIVVQGQPRKDDRALRVGKRTSCIADEELSKLGNSHEDFSTRVRKLEKQILSRIQSKITSLAPILKTSFDAMDEIDICQSFAQLRKETTLTRPEIVETPVLNIENGRHWAVEHYLQLHEGTNFISNDFSLGQNTLCMITGPNMGGKSTFMRQVAIISILSHMGCYVPAEKATIGLMDQIFCRIGSGDDGYRGMSTFMIEMLETAQILNHATPNSLALLDEVGRGTSKKDGVSLACGTIHHLVTKNRCRALFATHFGPAICDMVKSERLQIASLHSKSFKMVQGVCENSKGIDIAELVNFPTEVIEDAKKYIDSQ